MADLLLETWAEMKRRQTPNFFRLYLNPYAAQTCFCLNQYVQEMFNPHGAGEAEYQSFLANSFEEALSGALKLARYSCNEANLPGCGLVLDRDGRLSHFATTQAGTETLEFIPGVDVLGPPVAIPRRRYGFVVLFAGADEPRDPPHQLLSLIEEQKPLVIACVGRSKESLAPFWKNRVPDIVVFDGSFVRRQVPFGAFAAKKSLYDLWNRPRYATFHSTTFQPNATSTLHFMKCLEADDPEFFRRHASAFERAATDAGYCKQLLERLYNPSLCKTMSTVGMDTLDVTATGHYVTVNGRRIFDGISGIACSVRGHNPPGYREEMAKLEGLGDYHAAAEKRLKRLTGLDRMLPAVSGASAVEQALRLGLVAQQPRNYVLALAGGFGGKTLFALTGTANPHYKTRLDPLYPNVIYVDPFAPNAIAQLDAALERFPVGVVQMELVQGVGGVRAIPEEVVRFLDVEKRKRGYLLFVDEVQTGMFRTGPFTHSVGLGIKPDLLTLGKGVSDMMFPFSVTLYSAEVHERLAKISPDLVESLRRKHDYEFGYKTLINVLDRAEEMSLESRVQQSGDLFVELLREELAGCTTVRQVRGFGLLIAIELDIERGPRRWLKKKAHSVYLLDMLSDAEFPVLVGFCQYEPHVLKLTPPLTTTADEARRVCKTIGQTLRRPFYRLLSGCLGVFAQNYFRRRHVAAASSHRDAGQKRKVPV
jgi:acetylornithine/succinyldiaminopimelate/putrescine aminotransferase